MVIRWQGSLPNWRQQLERGKTGRTSQVPSASTPLRWSKCTIVVFRFSRCVHIFFVLSYKKQDASKWRKRQENKCKVKSYVPTCTYICEKYLLLNLQFEILETTFLQNPMSPHLRSLTVRDSNPWFTMSILWSRLCGGKHLRKYFGLILSFREHSQRQAAIDAAITRAYRSYKVT